MICYLDIFVYLLPLTVSLTCVLTNGQPACVLVALGASLANQGIF